MGNNTGMKKLLAYLNAMPKGDRESWCTRCGTSEGYLRKACSKGQRLGIDLCVAIEKESNRAVCCEDLLPDVDFQYLRTAEA